MRTGPLALCALCSLVGRAALAQTVSFVNGSGAPVSSAATEAVLVRDGATTTLTIQSAYDGPAEPFAMIVEVPGAVTLDDVKTLPRELVAKLSTQDAPRLVEYWEQDPCERYQEHVPQKKKPTSTIAPRTPTAQLRDGGATIEAQFTTGEYEIAIVEPKLIVEWLRREKYSVSDEAAARWKASAERGRWFVVAKVDPQRVSFDRGHAELSPLRVRVASPTVTVPHGDAELVVHVLARGQRYEVTNLRNVAMPTNFDVLPNAKDDFDAAYDALFTSTIAREPGAVVTEYARDLDTCDPCAGPALSAQELVTLGADSRGGWVLTRLHARGPWTDDELVLDAAPPISGGREFRGGDGALEKGTRISATNQFQARYASRHPWPGPIACEHPSRDRWGSPPQSGPIVPTIAHRRTGPHDAGALSFAGLRAPSTPDASVVDASTPEPKSASGGCEVGRAPALGSWVPLVALLIWRRRRR